MMDDSFCFVMIGRYQSYRREKGEVLYLGIGEDRDIILMSKRKYLFHQGSGESAFVIVREKDPIIFFFLDKLEYFLLYRS